MSPLCPARVISPTAFIVSCGNGAPLVIICHTCPLKDSVKHGFIISIKQGLTLGIISLMPYGASDTQ